MPTVAASNAFRLPNDGPIYADSIFSRCRDLISYEVWSGIPLHRLDTWIANFATAEEQYFAARVLDTLIYRSAEQVIALLRQLFSRVIPDLARCQKLPTSLLTADRTLRDDAVDPKVRIVPVIPPTDPPTKSGGTLARILKRTLRHCEQWIVYPDQVADEIGDAEAFIFVDDFLGTGEQFLEFLSDTSLDGLLSSACFVYGPLAGHKDGIEKVRSTIGDVHVEAVELLDATHGVFNEASGSFPDEVNSVEVARDFYYDLLANRGIHIEGPNRRGYGHYELAYAFEHAVPDNSLPILWWSQSNDWHPLFDR